ncbi:MAG TPA: hypothetical protein VK619_17960 [Pyrinomonadaceae bacterium]|nr:hypothetical protein [Pyrinomonadaceae bacterium]
MSEHATSFLIIVTEYISTSNLFIVHYTLPLLLQIACENCEVVWIGDSA